MNTGHLKNILDRFCDEYDIAGRINSDPIEFPYRYENPADKEITAFIAASLAYGRVTLFKPVINKILKQLGDHPAEFLFSFDVRKQGALFDDISYRFNTTDDIRAFLDIIHLLLVQYGSLKTAFLRHFDGSVYGMLSGFVSTVESLSQKENGTTGMPSGLKQLFPSPAGGSACKRMNLFLRWMVRDKMPDLGLWKEVPKSSLIIPLDTHIGKICRTMKLTHRKSNDWKTAAEITDKFSQFDPEDPVKYDFALCHQGISGMGAPLPN